MRGRKACSSNLRRSGSHPVLGQKLAVPISSSSWTTEARQAEARRLGWLASAERRRGGWVAARGRVGWIDSDPRVSTVRSSLPLCLLGSARTEPWAKLRSGASSETGQTAPFAGLARYAAPPVVILFTDHGKEQQIEIRSGVHVTSNLYGDHEMIRSKQQSFLLRSKFEFEIKISGT